MPLKKGQTNNKNGRPKGKPNKVTKNLKQLVQSFLEANISDLQDQYDILDPKDKLLFFERLLKFAIPTQTAAKIDFEKMTEEDLDKIVNQLSSNQ